MIIDITQELFSGKVYPGDKPPKLTVTQKEFSRISDFECCAHNGTHIDAPCHFIPNGGDIESIPLEKCIGECIVVDSAPQAVAAAKTHKKIILRGGLDEQSAKKLAGLDLIGTDHQSIGSKETHQALLKQNTVILEGLNLSQTPNGTYHLTALPLRLKSSDGSPTRAILQPISNK